MPSFKPPHLVLLLAFAPLLFGACETSPDDPEPTAPATLETLGPDAEPTVIAGHLLATRDQLGTTADLARHYPTLSREQAYEVQRLSLEQEEAEGDALIGWKLGGTRLTNPNAEHALLGPYAERAGSAVAKAARSAAKRHGSG